MRDIKAWWSQLEPREKNILFYGGLLALLFIFYFFMWRPFTSSIQTKRAEISNKIALVNWMKETVPQLKAIKTKQSKKTTTQKESLLIIVEQSLKKGRLSSVKPDITQSNSQVNVTFKTVAFTDLVFWLSKLQKEYALQVTTININATKESGVVKATLTLASI